MKLNAIANTALVLFAPISGLRAKQKTKRTLQAPWENNSTEFDDKDVGWSRIVGGQDASMGDYPWFVQWGSRSCGASLVAPDVVLSAAHCSSIWDRNVWIGGVRASATGGADGGVKSRIIRSTKTRHPDYNSGTLANDFMVMKLESFVTDKPILKINPSDGAPLSGDPLTVMGYGTLSSGGGQPTRLKDVVVDYASNQLCNSQYGSQFEDDVMFCAGVQGGGKDSCQGDSGGPIIQYVNGQPEQVGVVSWGSGCGLSNKYGVYARVSGEFDWIRDQICRLSDNAPDYLGCANDAPDDEIATISPTPAPTPAPVPAGTVQVDVQFKTDNYPEETTWFIGDYLRFDGDRTVGDEEVLDYTVYMPPGDYDFFIEDSMGDGMCCGFGAGYIKITAQTSDGVEILVDTEGNDFFDERTSIPFTVPAIDGEVSTPNTPRPRPTPSPVPEPVPAPETPARVCADTNESFLIDAVDGNRNCNFLARNLGRLGYLCQFIDVASKCKVTCDVCSLFGEAQA